LGVENKSFLGAKEWQAQISYQYGDTDDYFVGDQRDDSAGPQGKPPRRRVHLLNLDVAYALSNRVSLDVTVPYSAGSGGYVQQDQKFYKYNTSGLGDISLQAEFRLFDPLKPPRVRASVGLGVQAPTGSDNDQGTYYSPTTGTVERSIDEAFQLGNGGWGILVFAEGSTQISGPFYAYGSGYYGLSLNTRTDAVQGTAFRGVPDRYSARLGAAYLLPVFEGLVVSLGGRINGVTVRDVVGGGDLYWRRPGYEIFVEPGLTWTLGANSASVSYPIRAYQNKLDSLLDRSLNRRIGSDFVPYLILASYARRF
jgi:hypothetical protein